jgi:hypothetical protein
VTATDNDVLTRRMGFRGYDGCRYLGSDDGCPTPFICSERGDCSPVPEHPAKFSKAIIDRLGRMLVAEAEAVGAVKVLDPFAGPGGIHDLAQERVETFGLELQPEWAAAHADTICGSVLELPSIFPPSTFDVVATSPCYGNRMADHHAAADPCRECSTREEHGDALDPACRACGGSGLSRRNTYAHALRRAGVEPAQSDDNAQVMQWGRRYREFHEAAWRACDRVLRPGGLVLLNVKNHLRGNVEQRVVEFHVNVWLLLGYTLEEARRVETRGLAFGANHESRTPAELVVALRKAAA